MRARPVLGTGLRLRLWAALPVVLALAGVAVAVDDRALAVAVLALGVAYLARGLCDHARAVFRAHERLGDEGKLNAAIAVLAAAGGIAGLLAGAGGLAALALGVMAGTLAGAAYGFVLLGATMVRWAGPADWALARRMLREAAPFYLAGAFTLVYARADVLLLKPLSFDTEVGAYRAAGQLVELREAAAGAADDRHVSAAGARATRNRARRWSAPSARSPGSWLGGGFLLGGTLALAADPIITLLFGRDFGRAVPALRTLAPAVPLHVRELRRAALLHRARSRRP